MFGFVSACAKSAHVFQKHSNWLCGLYISNPSSDTKAFLATFPCALRLPNLQQYIFHCMLYGITLWAYLSEPFVKDSHINGKATISRAHLDHTLPLRTVTEKYTEILHVKKMADLVAVTQVLTFEN